MLDCTNGKVGHMIPESENTCVSLVTVLDPREKGVKLVNFASK